MTKPTKILMPATYATDQSKYANFPHAVQAQSGVTYQLQAEQIDGSPFDLTGYTMSGTIKVTAAVYPMTGTITITNPTAGRFTWEPESEDTAFAGTHSVQFRATLDPDNIVYSFPMNWQVSPTAEADASPASPLVGVPASDAACLAEMCAGNRPSPIPDPPVSLGWFDRVAIFTDEATINTYRTVDLTSYIPSGAKFAIGVFEIIDGDITGNSLEVSIKPEGITSTDDINFIVQSSPAGSAYSPSVPPIPLNNLQFEINMNGSPSGTTLLTVNFILYGYM